MGGQQAIMGRAAASLVRRGYTVYVNPDLVGDSTFRYAAGDVPVEPIPQTLPLHRLLKNQGIAVILPTDTDSIQQVLGLSSPQVRIVCVARAFNHHLTLAVD